MKTGVAAVLESVGGEAVVLEEVRAEASITDLLAEVSVTQRYRNPEPTNIEAVYSFPLPLDGVLLGFEAEIGGRKLAGTVVEKVEAERRYEDAITDGDSAVLLERPEPGLYTASVGNLLPGETATIRFRYGLLLRWNGERVDFTMPTTIAPRYGDPHAAGLAPHQVPEYAFDAERSFRLSVAVRGLLRQARFNSPSHAVSITSRPEETVIETVGAPAMDRDFVVEARLAGAGSAAALAARDLDGWVVLASFRPDLPAGTLPDRRSVKIVVDCSGSMGGDSIAQARAALERVLDGLRTGDMFDIVAFGSSHRALFRRATPVSETSLAMARRFVRALDADMGGTEIGAALDAAYGLATESGPPRDLLLITDGEVWDSGEVLARARRSGHRIFAVGVGSAVAEAFLRALAAATGGACELVAPRADMAERIHRHFQRLYAPRARHAQARWPVPPARSLPDRIESVYGGDTVHVLGWFAERPHGRVEFEVALSDGRTIVHDADIVPADETVARPPASDATSLTTVARLAAARRLAAMDDENEATALAVRYQLMSRWTSYVVVHVRAEGEKADDLPAIRTVPQVLAAGWHGIGSVHGRVLASPAESISACYGPPAFPATRTASPGPSATLPRAPAPLGSDFADVSRASRNVGPAELVELLNRRRVPPLPSLDELERLGIPEAIVEALRDLADVAGSEDAVVAAFLFALEESPAGRALHRRVRRQIIKAYKLHKLSELILDDVTYAFDTWQDLAAMECHAP